MTWIDDEVDLSFFNSCASEVATQRWLLHVHSDIRVMSTRPAFFSVSLPTLHLR
jgi:hypothetical protein